MSAPAADAKSIFGKALELESASRAAYLDEACAGDQVLRARIDGLIAAHGHAGEFMRQPAAAVAAEITAGYEPIAERPGTVIGPYKLMEQIGEGGMGLVFVAEQTQPVRRRVALKVIKPGMDTRQVVARFEAERQALALMDHPNIAKVFDGGVTDSGRPYFVMELVKGVPITDFCDRHRLPTPERLGLFLHVCRAVQHAHQKGVIHRDLKPFNILVESHDGTPAVKVIDFGIAKAVGQQLTDKTVYTQVAQLVGTPLYMSPEQAGESSLDVDTRTDVYALGVLLYELLTGTTPFDKDRMSRAGYDELRRIIREEEPPRPSTRISTVGSAAATASANRGSEPRKLSALVRGELDWIVMKCLEKDRNRRYESVSSLVTDVKRFLGDEPVHACPPSAWYRFRKFVRRNKRAVVTATAAALVVVAAVAGLATSNFLIAQAQWETANALGDANAAREDLKETNERERVDAYYRRIALAYRELSADNLRGALKLLRECPEALRGWEWRYLMRLCRVEPVVIQDKFAAHSISFSFDGERLACACGDGAVKIWNSRTGKIHQAFHAHKGFASSVAFHPQGNHLVSVGDDNLAKVWDLTTDPPSNVFERECDSVHIFGTAYAAAFSPLDPNHFAVGWKGTLRIWDWRDQKLINTFAGGGKHRISLAFSRDGRRLAWGCRLASENGREGLTIWNPHASGMALSTFPKARGYVSALAFSPDSERLATASFGRRVDVWETATGQLLRSISHSQSLVSGVAFSPDPNSQLIATAGEDKIVHVWDAKSYRKEEVLGLRGHTKMCGCVTFSPDGQRLASASMDGTILIWDATPLRGDERQDMHTFPEQSEEVWTLAVSPRGEKIASAGFAPPVVLWDAKAREEIARFSDFDSVVFCVAWDGEGKRIALAGASGFQHIVKVKHLDAKDEQKDFTIPGNSEYFAVAFSSDGKYLVTGNRARDVEVWDANKGQRIHRLGTHNGVLRGVVFSPDGEHLATMCSDGEVKLWDATRIGDKKLPQATPRKLQAHSPGVGLNMAFRPDGKRLATGGKQNTVTIWDVGTSKEVCPPLRGHSGDVSTVAFSPNGRWVASGGEDTTVKVWDSNTGELLRNFRGHEGLVSTMAFLDDRTLITGSRDRTIKLWDLTQLEELPRP